MNHCHFLSFFPQTQKQKQKTNGKFESVFKLQYVSILIIHNQTLKLDKHSTEKIFVIKLDIITLGSSQSFLKQQKVLEPYL